jgi:cell division protein FtsB
LKLRLRLGAACLLIGGLALTGLAPARQAYQQRRVIRQQEGELASLQARNAGLAQRLARLQDPAYQEKLAREQLGVVRPGESAYVVVPRPGVELHKVITKPPPPSGLQRAWHWLRGLLHLG